MSNLLEKASILLTPTAYDDGKILSVKPIDGSGDFDFTRNSDATRVNSAGLIESLQTLSSNLVSNGDFSQQGPELVENGDFLNYFSPPAAGTGLVGGVQFNDWYSTQGLNRGTATLSYSNGGYRKTITTVGGATAGWQQRTNQGVDSDLVVGKTYNFSVVVELNFTSSFRVSIHESNSTNPQIGGSFDFVANVPQTISGQFTCTSNTSQIIDFFSNTLMTAGQYYEIRDVSLKEAAPDWSVTGSDANNYVEFNGSTARLKFLNPSLVTQLISSFVMTAGKKYKLTVDVATVTNGGIKVDGNGISETFDTSGITTRIINPTGATAIKFYRARSASVDITLNSVSLIEITDDTNLPRIDYSPYSGAGTCGHWLFEPQSTQTATHSNDFTQGDIFVSSAPPSVQESVLTSQQAISPDGTNNAWKLVDNNDGLTGRARFNTFSTTVIANNYNTISYFVKKQGSNNFVYINTTGFDAGASGATWFDIQNGTLGDVSANHTANIENYGNGWYRISITMQATTDVVGAFSLILATSNGAGNILRDGTNGVYFFGVQAESDASRQFMTSYIPTSGSTVTRNQEEAFGSGNSSLINSTEGVLYAEIAALYDYNDNTARTISITNNTSQEIVRIYYYNNLIVGNIKTGGADVFTGVYTSPNQTDFIKIALKYKQNDFSFFVNGTKIASDTSGNTPSGLDLLNFNFEGINAFFGKTKCLAVFKEALTDDELECLTSDETSFSSFNALALANNYTII